MFNFDEKILQIKGARLDLKMYGTKRLRAKIEKMNNKLEKKEEDCSECLVRLLDDWSKSLYKDGYRNPDGSRIDIKLELTR